MNTAPKLLRERAEKARDNLIEWRKQMPQVWYGNSNIDAAYMVIDELLAALAPPSGEGVGLTVADAWFESPTEITIHAKASGGAKLPEEGTKIYTTPQSAPEDGDKGLVNSGPDAAEQAKPDDNMQLRARVAGELIAARDTEDGCNRIMALIATLDTYTAQTECVAAMYPAEQAQAGEVWRYIWNPMGMIARDRKQFAECDLTEYVTLADYNALLRRLAGGVTVEEPERRCPYCAGLIYSDAGCQNCKVGSVWPKPVAAEQASSAAEGDS